MFTVNKYTNELPLNVLTATFKFGGIEPLLNVMFFYVFL